MDQDVRFMTIALELAGDGRGRVEPNPMVGAVLVRDGREIAHGCHERFGGPHAEIVAIQAAQQAGHHVAGATMYVTLEPCCHFGKTPPCTEALIRERIARVVVAMTDPDPRVSGRGIELLRAAGLAVAVGVCEREAQELLAPYVALRTRHRPWVIGKWAQTADGYLRLSDAAGSTIDRPGLPRQWISGEPSRAYAHYLRGLCDGILVGVGTVLADDPLLTARGEKTVKQPVRVVLDSNLHTPPDSRVVQSADASPVLIATTREAMDRHKRLASALRQAGVELFATDSSPRVDLRAVLNELGSRQWTYLLVEGGQTVLESFLGEGLVDEFVCFSSPRTLAATAAPKERAALPRLDIEEIRTRMNLREMEARRLGEDLLRRFRLPGAK